MVTTDDAATVAHGVAATGAESILDFGGLGFTHMLGGWDHLLFIVGVVLLAWRPRRALGLVSLFALGHSITLITATLAGWRFEPEFVDVVIAVSVGVVGTIGVVGRPRRFRWFGLLVLGFGLVHGLGLATRFQELTVPEGGLVSRLLAFNVGVEVGQFTAVYLIYLFGELVVRRPQWPRIEWAGFAGLAAVGLVLSATMTFARL
jgi:hydrogenase/urease accessory protein HupE